MLPHIMRQSIRANRKNNIIYLNNPKVGCSTIKSNLWKILSPATFRNNRDIHDIESSPFANIPAAGPWISTANIFTFVRNPFTRAVSAFLNKIEGRNDNSWGRFSARYGLDENRKISFAEFVEIIANSPVEELDPHWRPQHINLMYPFIRPNFIGYLEEMDAQLPQVLSRFLDTEITETRRRSKHKTTANEQFQGLFDDPEILRMFLSLYQRDFDYFGYSTDVKTVAAQRPVAGFSENTHAPLAGLVSFRRAKTPEARMSALKTIGGFQDAMRDSFVRDWYLHAMIETGMKQGANPVALIRDNLDAIISGHEFLRRTARRIAADQGEPELCERLADGRRIDAMR